MQDEIIRVLFDFVAKHLYPAQNPSEAEHMAVVATGGYGRGVLAAGSDIDLLFPAALQANGVGRVSRRGHPLLPVGHGAQGRPRHPLRRRVHPPGQGRHDYPHRHPRGAVSPGRPQALRRARHPLRQGGRAGHRGRIRRRQARRARGTSPAGGPVALSGRAQRQGRQGRSARPAHALLDRQIRLSRARARRAHRARRLRPARIPAVSPLRRFSLGGALPHALSDRTRRGAALVRYPARDRGAARLHRASRLARRRALHEALLLDRQGRRRPHRHSLRQARGQPGQGDAGAQPDDGPLPAAHAPHPDRDRRFCRRLQPHQRRRRERLQARSRQPDPHLPSRAKIQSGVPPRRHARGDALAQADRPEAARGRGGEPAVPGNPDLEQRRRDRAAADERGRRARPLRARLRPHRGDDAVQHVPPLHRGRASAALRRRPLRHRGRPHRGHQVRQRADAHDPAAAPRAALCHAVPARHRQGPDRGPFDRRRAGRAQPLPAARLLAGRDRDRRLADRGAPRDVVGRAVARSLATA